MDAHDLPDRFDPWPPGTEPEVPVPGYPNTWTHTPSQPLHRRPVGRTEATGPLELQRKLPCGDSNLAQLAPGRIAIGQLMHLSGRILDEDGRPVRGAIVVLNDGLVCPDLAERGLGLAYVFEPLAAGPSSNAAVISGT